ncbi:hypothetical protein NEPAR06_0851 [Nematocida parisii]|uniref:Uncharacterized protein n=1 Tax=Nematocida parisii (strain ERTm3) TaxID=935791 RepID=I3EES8_NEMP3|nr:uncharacterized protein NEPG_02354 [Nematocida parisii ERTm1]EIJ87725.1 hypothetical protein NEQG_02272 [Nematocida parisii ERTm3]EIJ92955.1 hypothetical protein NEPG_02354 [Nematocida parisii ERTm1]KAI5144058.1 hypothetical protein NEPAR07_1035 [Nematocida parisii]KAI5154074.1 hypothetical protein NEPAR06_0851 [Nematocida parisii]|eukprot:XP_013060181.1 hypothetical protein NEPG_02354 [Nematocida parisii ERTm1]
MQIEKTSQIQKLKNTFPWVIYYGIATVNFSMSVYLDFCSAVPFSMITNPSFIFLILTTFVFFSVYIQSPPSIIAHTRPINNIIVSKLLSIIAICDVIILSIISHLCITGKYYSILFFASLLVQIGIYSEYLLKLIVPYLPRLPVENYILSISIEMEMDERDSVFYDFHFLFYVFNFLFIFCSSLLVFLSVCPMDAPISSFIFKNLYCLFTYYCLLYIFMSACVIAFYLKINSGSQKCYRLVSKLILKNIGVIIFMAGINLISAVGEVFFNVLSGISIIRSILEDIGSKYFMNIIFYRKVGIAPIVVISTILEKEPDEVVEFIKEVEAMGDYPYISSFSTTHSGRTTARTSLSIITIVLFPLLMTILITSLKIHEFYVHAKLIISLCWAVYCTACIWYIYSESLYYAALLSNIQGSPQGKKWINAYLNTL